MASAGGGLLGFLQAYPNPLSRLGFASVTNAPGRSAILPSIPEGENGGDKEESCANEKETGDATMASGLELDSAGSTAETSRVALIGPRKDVLTGLMRGQYSFSTLVFVALIAFLIGSLLRSLLSPADFIYVVKDLEDAEESTVSVTGWREIRRLLEIKYLVGGWDFQVAVVRRH